MLKLVVRKAVKPETVIAISSFRPLDDSPEVSENQLRAKQSWELAFTKIIYFNEADDRLASPKTEFLKWEPFPQIRALMYCAKDQEDWACILNADVVVSRNVLQVERALESKGGVCALSRRYQFERGKPLPSTGDITPHDNGLDFFCGIPLFWELAFKECPPVFRLGKIVWDTWLMVFMAEIGGPQAFDITLCRTVFHPKHGGRRDQNIEPPKDDRLKRACWPRGVLRPADLQEAWTNDKVNVTVSP